MSKSAWEVHKFGGTSVGSAERYQAVGRIVRDLLKGRKLAIVVSAMKGVTDGLIDCVERARKRDDSYSSVLGALKKRHLEAASQLVSGEAEKRLHSVFESDFKDIQEVLRGAWQARTASDAVVELVSGFGEVWSAQLLQAALAREKLAAEWMDAREVLVVDSFAKSVNVRWKESQTQLNEWLGSRPCSLVVITGFVASTADGVPTTLKRNGSDFSASIFGSLLKASEIVIWTDVDGVLSADPRLVPDAIILDELSYQEVSELAYFGAKVVHPATMEPAFRSGIPIWVKNTFRPELHGTKIHGASRADRPVKGFSAIDGMALINVEGTGMAGVPGVAERLFGSLRDAEISVTLISQASSEHSICFAVADVQAEAARKAVEQAFAAEMQRGLIQKTEVTRECSILAAVGDGMVSQPGTAGQFFSALGRAGVNILAIAQGSSERNISAVISGADATRALRTVHSAFYLSNQTLSVGVIGTGLIGGTFLKQLAHELEALRRDRQIDVRVRAIATTRKMLLDARQIDLASFPERLRETGEAPDLERFAAHVRGGELPHSVIIDATASDELPRLYPKWLASGIHVITPNKKANTGKLASYLELRAAAQSARRHFLYSTNVGAGLPILQTLRDLHRTGDRVLQIQGVLSGTLSYIFNSFTGEKPFSAIVAEAKALGYTEPDPRDDLSGMDVARKLVILGREIGLKIELDDIEIENLVPAPLRTGSVESFLKQLPAHDAKLLQLLEAARSKQSVLRYVGQIDESGHAQVKLTPVAAAHPLGRLSGSDNMVMIRTARYDRQPLVIQGPGAGPEVTAAGVFADLLRLASYVGAPS